MDFNEALNKLNDNPDLVKKLEGMWKKGTPDFCSFYNVCDDLTMQSCSNTSNLTW